MKPPKKKFVYKLDTVFNFGKHKGESLLEILSNDVRYIRWCIEEVENFEMDLEATKMYGAALALRAEADSDNEDFIDMYDFCF